MTTATLSDRYVSNGNWRGGRCFVLCGGPSVSSLDISRLRGQRVITINSSAFTWPDADFLLFTDQRWWTRWRTRVIQEFRGRVIAVTPMHRANYYQLMERARMSGISMDPSRLACSHTTVTAAINLAVHELAGHGEVGMLGLDGKDAPDGRSWHHEPHPEGWGRNPERYVHHGVALGLVAADVASMTSVRVYNCNPDAAHKMFPYRSFEEMTA